jgi:cytochrome b6
MAFGFSGYLLPWNEISYFGTRVATESIASIPVIGHYLLVFFRGGEDVSGATLTRFFGFHVAVLPLLLTMVLIVHLLMVQVQGMSVPLSVEKQPGPPPKTSPFFPNFILKDCLGWLITLGLLALLAALYPWELGVKADPFAPAPAGIKPEWYFLFLFQTLKLIPATIFSLSGEMIAVMTFAVVGILWALVPFIDRRANRSLKSPLFTILGVGAIVYIAVMTVIAYMVSKK